MILLYERNCPRTTPDVGFRWNSEAALGTEQRRPEREKSEKPRLAKNQVRGLFTRSSLFVDGSRVNEHRLRAGDVFRVGDTRLRFE